MTLPKTWVIPQARKALVVGVADMVTSNDPGAELVTYSLGSCLGIVIYDPIRKAGGLLHIMLPDSSISLDKAATKPYMFVDTGVPRLFKSVFNLGGDRSRIAIKVAGGAQFLDPERRFNIGERNAIALQNLLGQNGYTIHARDTGGFSSRTMRLDMSSGNVTISSPGVPPYRL